MIQGIKCSNDEKNAKIDNRENVCNTGNACNNFIDLTG